MDEEKLGLQGHVIWTAMVNPLCTVK